MQVRYSNITGSEPITAAEAKAWIKVDFSDEDAVITSLISAVREKIEEFTGLALIAKTVEVFYTLDEVIYEDFNGTTRSDNIFLPFPEHNEITEVKVNGTATDEYVSTGLGQKIIKLNSIPIQTTAGDDAGVIVKFTTTGVCLEAIKVAMKKNIAELYENRENTSETVKADLTENTYAMLAQYVQY
jgi:hypothetical protein